MMLIPYERFTIYTSLHAEEVLRKLEDIVEPRRYFQGWWAQDHKPYEGKIEGYHFTINRIIHYRNSFIPVIEGDIQSEAIGCSVRITMHLHTLVIAFMALWMGGVGYASLASLRFFVDMVMQADAQPSSLLRPFLIPAAFLVFGYAMTLIGFKVESNKSRSFFRTLFQAERVDEFR